MKRHDVANGRMRLIVSAIVALAAFATANAGAAVAEPRASVASATFEAGTVCLPSTAPHELDRLFDSGPGGVLGADYQRTTPLENGDVLWTFQDATVERTDGTLALIHNIGVVQSGACFTVLMGGTAAEPLPWLFTANTIAFERWYWPLDATVGADGILYVFVAEMAERGDTYLSVVEPTATRVAGVDTDTWEVVSLGSPFDDTPALHGWSITSDREWTYLYAQCHRQFGYDLVDIFPAHDVSCSDRVTVARVARGDVFGQPTYWTGAGWSTEQGRATPVIETDGRRVNATDIVHIDGNWLAVTKVDDWWGDEIVVESAVRATGPFVTTEVIQAVPKCEPLYCNTYYASWVTPAAGQLAIGLSHNRWDGVFSSLYRPTFRAAAYPDARLPPAGRCDLGHCD